MDISKIEALEDKLLRLADATMDRALGLAKRGGKFADEERLMAAKVLSAVADMLEQTGKRTGYSTKV